MFDFNYLREGKEYSAEMLKKDKCPFDENSKSFFRTDYQLISSTKWKIISLWDIMEANDVGQVQETLVPFDSGSYNNN